MECGCCGSRHEEISMIGRLIPCFDGHIIKSLCLDNRIVGAQCRHGDVDIICHGEIGWNNINIKDSLKYYVKDVSQGLYNQALKFFTTVLSVSAINL